MNSPISSSPNTRSAATVFAPETTDSMLIEHCRSGDLNAFDILVERHQDRVFNLCYWVLGNREEALDASQDAFVRAFRSISNFRGESAFGTWIHRIAVNSAIDMSHRRKRRPLAYADLTLPNQSDDQETSSFEPSTPDSDDPGQSALRKERRDAVRNALAALPDHYRLVLVLLDIEGNSYEEIAQLLKMPMGTVKSRINRARYALKEQLQPARELFEN